MGRRKNKKGSRSKYDKKDTRLIHCSLCKVSNKQADEDIEWYVCGDCITTDPIGYQRIKAGRSIQTFKFARQAVDPDKFEQKLNERKLKIDELREQEKEENREERKKITRYITRFWKKKVIGEKRKKERKKIKEKETQALGSLRKQKRSLLWKVRHSTGYFIKQFDKKVSNKKVLKWAMKNGYEVLRIKPVRDKNANT